ncbi:MAG: lysophospholipid acyltransferase family protein [Candidatus Helarchaeota archaeon]
MSLIVTAVEEFFKENYGFEQIHNSQIIIDRLDEIDGTSQFPLDSLTRRIKKSSINTVPFIDTFLDFLQISVLETILRIFDFRVKEIIVGRERIPEGTVIFAPNHETETEHLYLARACCPRRDLNFFKYLTFLNLKSVAKKRYVPIFFAKYQLFNIPIVSSLFASTAFPVEREIKDTKSLDLGSQFLQKGQNILIYPEGTRNLEKMQKPKSGVIRLAIRNKVPIIPVGHVGLWELTKGSFVPNKSGYWYCEFGDPIYYDQYYDQELDYLKLRELADELMEKIEKLRENGRKKIKELNKIQDAEKYEKGNLNEIVTYKFNKLEKIPTNPIDSLFRAFLDYTAKIPIIGERIDSFLHFLVRLGVDALINPTTFNVKINGLENLEAVKPAVICSNHESFLDIGLYGLYLIDPKMRNYYGYLLPGDNNSIDKTWFMMKRELAEIPIISSWTLAAGGFPVKRGEKDKEAMRIAEELVKKNRNVVIFPQQTTYPEIDVDSETIKTGGVRLAIKTKRPVVPVSIKGSHDAMKKGVLQLLFPPKAFLVEINIGKPIYYEDYYDKEPSYEELKHLTRELMIKIKDLQDKKIIEYKEKKSNVHSPVDWFLKLLGRIVGLPRTDLQKSTIKLPFEKMINNITDKAGFTSTVDKKEKSKDKVSLNPIDKFLMRLKKTGERFGLFPLIDDAFYSITKRSIEFLVNNLYDFRVKGAENIPTDGKVGVILLTQSNSKLDFVIGSSIISEKVHFMIDAKIYKTPVVSTLLQSLGFFRQTQSKTDFGPLLHIKKLLKDKKIIGVFPEVKNKDRLIGTIAGILKMAIEGKPTVIVPLAIKGTDTPFPPVKINVVIGKPIGPIKRMKREKRYELAVDIYKKIKDLKSEAYNWRN